MCVLRNLSYRLENEVDPQEGGEDVLDREWEQEQRRDMEDLDRSFTKASPGCLAFCTRPQTKSDTPTKISLTSVNRPLCSVDFVNPGGWACLVGVSWWACPGGQVWCLGKTPT